MLILESNQNHARAENTEVCPCLPASMGLGGGYVPMIVEPLIIREDITIKVDEGGFAFSLDTMHRQQAIMVEAKNESIIDRERATASDEHE